MVNQPTQISPAEITRLRSELANYHDPKVIADLDVIERCEGNLEQASRVLAHRAGVEQVRGVENWQLTLEKAREIICDDKFKEGLAPGLIGGLIGALATSGSPLMAAVATPTSIYITQVSIDAFCEAKQSTSEDRKNHS